MQKVPFSAWAKRDNPLELFYPRNAGSTKTSVASDLAAWTWPTNYTQLQGSTSEDFVPHMVHLAVSFTAIVTSTEATLKGPLFEYEIATGAAGSEVPIGNWCFSTTLYTKLNGTSVDVIVSFGLSLPMGPTLIPSATRLAHRARVSIATTGLTVGVSSYIAGYAAGAAPAEYAPYDHRAHLAGIHKAQTKQAPRGSTLSVIANSTWGTYGTWVDVLGTTAPSDLLVWGATKEIASVTASNHYMEFGTGISGSQVPRARIAFPGHGSAGNAGIVYMHRPFVVKAGESLWVRTTGSGSGKYQVFYEEL